MDKENLKVDFMRKYIRQHNKDLKKFSVSQINRQGKFELRDTFDKLFKRVKKAGIQYYEPKNKSVNPNFDYFKFYQGLTGRKAQVKFSKPKKTTAKTGQKFKIKKT